MTIRRAPRFNAASATATGAPFLPEVEISTSTSSFFSWEHSITALPTASLCSTALVRKPGVVAMLMPGPHSGRQNAGVAAR